METRWRSVVKALIWRLFSTVVTVCVSLAITHELKYAAAIGIGDLMIKTGSYYVHERIWARMEFGRVHPQEPEYEI